MSDDLLRWLPQQQFGSAIEHRHHALRIGGHNRDLCGCLQDGAQQREGALQLHLGALAVRDVGADGHVFFDPTLGIQKWRHDAVHPVQSAAFGAVAHLCPPTVARADGAPHVDPEGCRVRTGVDDAVVAPHELVPLKPGNSAKRIVDIHNAAPAVGDRNDGVLVERFQQRRIVPLDGGKLQAALGEFRHVVHERVEALDLALCNVRQIVHERVPLAFAFVAATRLLEHAGLSPQCRLDVGGRHLVHALADQLAQVHARHQGGVHVEPFAVSPVGHPVALVRAPIADLGWHGVQHGLQGVPCGFQVAGALAHLVFQGGIQFNDPQRCSPHFAHVAQGLGQAHDAAMAVLDGAGRDRDIDQRAVPVAPRCLVRLDPLPLGHHGQHGLVFALAPCGYQQLLRGVAQHLVRLVPEEPPGPVVPVGDDALQGLHDDGIVRPLHDGRAPGLFQQLAARAVHQVQHGDGQRRRGQAQ